MVFLFPWSFHMSLFPLVPRPPGTGVCGSWGCIPGSCPSIPFPEFWIHLFWVELAGVDVEGSNLGLVQSLASCCVFPHIASVQRTPGVP
eukprot:12920157-Prorocentrum_lima.AAC.1